MKKKKTGIVVAVALLLLVSAGSSWGADFPNKPVRVLVAFAGSASDLLMRAMAPTAEKILGQPVVMETKAGGFGVLALELTKSSKPDGYTMACVPDAPITGSPHMLKVSYNPQKDFSSIVMFYSEGGLIAVRSDSPFKKFQDFVEYASKNPDKLTMGLAGTGNNIHLSVIQITNHDKIKIQYVPFQGAGPNTTALLGGHVMSASSSAGVFLPHIKAGTLRGLLVLGKKRMPEIPDVPTADELGYPADVTSIAGIKGILTVSKAVPQPIKNTLITAFSRAVSTPEYLEFVSKNGYTVPSPPLVGEALDKHLQGLSDLAQRIIYQTGLQKK